VTGPVQPPCGPRRNDLTRDLPAAARRPKISGSAVGREVRLFDERRYTHSLRLPEVIRSIGDRRCFHTGHDNFFTVELIDAQGERVEYTVYFKLSRAPSKGRLNLYVQSAYVQDDIPQRRPKPRKPIRFSAIAYNVAIGKAIKVPK
jgi:hypothetical protein